MDENPYASPRTESRMEDVIPPGRPVPSRLSVIFVPALCGALTGFMSLPSYTRGVGDPGGESIATSLGGIAGLVVGLVLRFWIREREQPFARISWLRDSIFLLAVAAGMILFVLGPVY